MLFREIRDWADELACRAGLDGWPTSVRMVALVLVATLLAVAVWWWLPRGPVPGEAPEADRAGSSRPAVAAGSEATRSKQPAVPASVTVHVVGAVRRPAVYVLAAGVRAGDAVEAAGGLLGNADPSAVNLARVLADGEQLVIPVQGSPAAGEAAPVPGAGAGAPVPAVGKIDLNTATAEQLDALPGVGPATAQKIVGDRTENGPFTSVDDLLRVPGIGPAKLDALKDLVRVG